MSTNVSYACIGCVDFINNERTAQYVKWACATNRFPGSAPPIKWLCWCDGDNSSPNDIFVDPITDDVCWYDPLIPESADFLGIAVRKVSGLRASTFTRELMDGVSGGTILQKPLIKGKQLAFEVVIFATSCEGMDYGFEWMRRVLEDDSSCGSGSACESCEGDEFTIRVHCPDGTTEADDIGLHKFITAGTIDGFTLVEDEYPMGRENCCVMRVATFAIATESPYSFAICPSAYCEQTINHNSYDRCWFLDCSQEPPTICCPFCTDSSCDRCNVDPLCDCLPPLLLPVEKIETTCFRQPMCRTINAFCTTQLPHGYDTALKIGLFAGQDPSNDNFTRWGLRNTVIRVFENPDMLPCPDDNAAYEVLTSRMKPCAEIAVSWIPAGSTLNIDGTSERITLSCGAECYDHSRRVEAISGSIFPLITRCIPLVIVVEYDCMNSQSDDTIPAFPSSASVQTFRRFRL